MGGCGSVRETQNRPAGRSVRIGIPMVKLLVLLALLACMYDDSHRASDLSAQPARESEQKRFERLLRQHHLAAKQALQNGKPEVGRFCPGTPVSSEQLSKECLPPPSVLAARDFYFQVVERHDWGSVRVFESRPEPISRPTWVVWVSTDGDDGWVELFDASGLPLAAGRTYLELVGWNSTEENRAYALKGGFPGALEDRATRTLWASER
jgi:hypothetical protein